MNDVEFFIPPNAGIQIDRAWTVRDVVDGDTVILDDGYQVRLIGIDAPEIDEFYYDESKTKLISLCRDRLVRLEADIKDKDMYERLLRYVYVGDKFVNWEMVRLGYARAYEFTPNVKYSGILYEAESAAKNEGIGIWNE